MLTAEYLADLAWEWHEGKRDRVRKLLDAADKEVEEHDGYWIVRTTDFSCGLLLDTTPQDAMYMILFAVVGPYWPLAFGEAYTKAQQIISKRLRAARKGSEEGTIE